MPMILSVAFPFAPVGPDPVGGAEQVLAAIDQRLAAEAWPSIALAAAGSRVAGELVELAVPGGVIDDAVRARVHAMVRAEIARLLEERAIELVHCHGGDLLAYLPETDVPVVATLHLPAAFYPREVLDAPIHRVCVSSSQRRTFGPEAAIPEVIPNGVALDRYRPVAQKGDFVLALGRLCPEKGFDLALDAARAARVPLILAGMVFPYEAHQRHVREAIMPRLDADRRWIGSVAGATKRALLAEARCLLITSRVDETSSLVAMEALASGTPVAGLRRGALPELIEQGRTGYLVDDPGELPEAIARATALSPEACREAARERASAEAMTARYLELYRGLVRARPRMRPRPAPCDAVLLTTDDELAAIAGEWDALCDRCPSAMPFQRPAWLLAWRRWFGEGAQPRAIALRRAGRLVGLVPLELRDGVLRLIGSGISDYLDAIAEPELDLSPLGKLVRLAAAGARVVELDALRPSSPLRGLDLGGGLVAAVPSPVVSLAARRIPPRLGYERRRLDRAGAVRWEDESGDRDGLLEGLFALHRQRWTTRGERGVLDHPAIQRFHREAAAALHARGLLRLTGLHLDERLIGVLYGFSDHGRSLFYLSGFAPDVASLAPGRLLIARALERAIDEGAFEFDFLRGREPYKYEWGAVDRSASIYRARIEKESHARDSLDDR